MRSRPRITAQGDEAGTPSGPIPLAWILLKIARPGKSMLPMTAELKATARG